MPAAATRVIVTYIVCLQHAGNKLVNDKVCEVITIAHPAPCAKLYSFSHYSSRVSGPRPTVRSVSSNLFRSALSHNHLSGLQL